MNHLRLVERPVVFANTPMLHPDISADARLRLVEAALTHEIAKQDSYGLHNFACSLRLYRDALRMAREQREEPPLLLPAPKKRRFAWWRR